MALLEGIEDILDEDQTKGDVLVFAGVHVAAHLVSSGPEFLLKA